LTLPDNLKLKVICEGKAKLYVPDMDYYGHYVGDNEPSHAPVFYNPRMTFDRSLSVLVVNQFRSFVSENLRICDAFSGTGVRGIRYGLEVDGVDLVWFNDWNPLAVELIHKNILLNSIKPSVIVSCLDARRMFFMNSSFNRRFHVIDIDPFGSPSKFIQPAIASLKDGGLMCITATDVPVLFGKYPTTCLRRYGSIPIESSFSQEIAVRILLGYISRNVSTYDFSCTPLLCYSRAHYIRIFARFNFSVDLANESMSKLGYISFCDKCLHRFVVNGILPPDVRECPNCNSKLHFSGPLWVGPLFNPEFILELRKHASTPDLTRFLDIILDECRGPPTFYVLDEISKILKTSSPSVDDILEELKSMGFFASRTHFHAKGIRTDAPSKVLFDLVKSSSS
jgi:tRNA (guanine26-N2/guanine27-N2)-dimethyltransferase